MASKTEEIQCNYLMLWVGEKGRQIYSTWDLTNEQKKKLKHYYDKFEEYCKPKSNVIYNRYLFKSRTQQENEPFEQFVTELKTLIKDCDYPVGIQQDLIRDHIVFGVRSSKVREKLIMEGSELTLEKCVDVAHTYELSQSQAQAIDTGCTAPQQSVDEIHRRRRRNGRKTMKMARDRMMSQQQQRFPQQRKTCERCGNKHSKSSDCPAQGQKCFKCGRINHFAKLCKFKPVHELQYESDNSDYKCDSDSETDQAFYVHTVNSFSSTPDQVFVNVLIGTPDNNSEINCKIDTGSQINCIPNHIFRKLNLKHPLVPSNARLTSYTGDRLPVHGKIQLHCKYNNKSVCTDFYVVESSAPPLLSLKTSVDLDLLRLTYAVNMNESLGKSDLNKDTVLSEYKDLFKGIGLFQGMCSLNLKKDAIPVVCPPRKTPFGLREKLKTELDSMESKQIICKVTEPTEWVNSLVCVEKQSTGKLRVCLDPKALNENIQRPYYPLRSIDDITSKLHGAKYFSVLDATKGYWSIKLDDHSSYLTTFNTVFGRYRYLRLPMGIRSSQDIFQRKIDETFENLDGVTSIIDDLLVFGSTRTEHDRNLRNVLERAKAVGLRFNPDKLKIGLTEVKYFGHVISADGLKPDPEKISAILKMRNPENRAELETLLGMITYLTKFSQNLSEITSPMRELLRKDVEFRWDSAQNEAFNKVKQVITQAPVLSFYDSSKPVRLQVDASSKGIGVCCLQNGKPIAYASKTLTLTETGYAQIEKEMLAILFGCNRFKHYIYGRRTVVESDCKPIVSIMRKPLNSAPPRLQRMLLQLQDFDLDVIHCRGKDIPLGDALSRNYVTDTFPDLIEGLDTHVHTVLKSLPISDLKLQEIQTATSKDLQLQTLISVISDGWPSDRRNCPLTVLEYWNHRDELSYKDNIVFKGQKIVIPKSFRQDMTDAVHVGHFGVEKTTRRARDIMFWPSMTKQITDYVLNCQICCKYRDSNQKEPLHPHDVPERPWQYLSCDLFTWNGQEFMVLVDAYSRYFEFDLLTKTTSTSIIRKLKVHFSRFGICEKLKTDNGTCFTSETFQNFLKQWNIMHETSSPKYASSNGLSEVYVKIAKRILQKSKDANKDPYMPLLEYRNTPLKCGYSPAQLLMGRRLKSLLPTTNKQLSPQNINHDDARKKMKNLQIISKNHYDKSARKLKTLNIGESVRIQKDKIWEPAKVISQHNDHSFHGCSLP